MMDTSDKNTEDVFEEKHSQYIVVKDAGKIQIREIRFFLIKR